MRNMRNGYERGMLDGLSACDGRLEVTDETSTKWLWDNADTIGIGCMWFVAAIDLVISRKLDDACVGLFATVRAWSRLATAQNWTACEPSERNQRTNRRNCHRAGAGCEVREIWTDNVNALHLKIDVEGAMLKQKGN